MVGADICGFGGNTAEELCIRWYQLGAFYSFARNHNDIHSIDQDPAALGESVIRAARSSLQYRYRFLAHLYTLFYHVHKNGGTVLRPMFFEFPHDEHTYEIETQFMWGDSVLIAPILYPNQTQVCFEMFHDILQIRLLSALQTVVFHFSIKSIYQKAHGTIGKYHSKAKDNT